MEGSPHICAIIQNSYNLFIQKFQEVKQNQETLFASFFYFQV